MKPFHSHPICPHFNSCSGCQIDLKDPIPPVWQEALAFFQNLAGITPILHEGPAKGWRCRAKLAVRGKPENPLIGLFKEGSHEVISIPFCQVHHPRLNQAVEIIRQWMIKNELKPYDESSGKGDLRYIQLVLERQTGKVQISFVLNFKNSSDPHFQRWNSLIQEFGEQRKSLLHSLWVNFNAQRTNTIFISNWHHVWGEEWLWECFGSTWACYQPANFAQANLDLFERMLERLQTFLPSHARVAELYAGVGVIGLFLVNDCEWVRCVELNPHSEKCFQLSRARPPAEAASKISFQTGSAQDLTRILKEANAVIVDPPRKGIDASVLKAIENNPTVEQLIYISCGWPAFKKDALQLIQKGWYLKNAEAYLFFPGTNHIEVLANFIRNK